MTHGISRRALIGAALAALAAPALAAPAVSLRPRLRPDSIRASAAASRTEAMVAKARLSGQVSYAVMDAGTGEMLESRAPDAALAPASVTKAVTALYALDTLGAGHRFATRLLAAGPVEDGVLRGDLVLAGGGDPTLDTDALADMAAGLKRAGVREVTGAFRVWGGAVAYRSAIDPRQPVTAGYNPALSGLNLNFNRVHFEWRRAGEGYAVSMDARSGLYRPDVSVARMRVANRRAPIYAYKDAGDRDDWSVARGALGGGGARWLPVRKPELYAGEVFATFARSHGLVLGTPQVDRGAMPRGETLVTHASAPLDDILQGMLRYSTNLTAEMVGLAASARRLGAVPDLPGSAAEMTVWARAHLGMQAAELHDHSGLNDRSRLSAADMVRALAGAGPETGLRPLLREFTMRDAQGRPVRDHPVEVQAKTGTLYFVSALAGYATAPGDRDLAFAILSASDSLRSGIDPAADSRPRGSRGWGVRARRLQRALIDRWGTAYRG